MRARRALVPLVVGGLLALSPLQSQAATGRVNLTTTSATGGAPLGFDIDTARLVVTSASSVDLRLGTNTTTGYRQILALNSAGVAKLGAVDFASVTCDTLKTTAYASSVVTGDSLSDDPVPGTVYAAKSVTDTYIKMILIEVDLVAPNGLVLDYVTDRCLDSTPPVISSTVGGTLGGGGYYTSDVTVSWSATDAESAISETSGCGTATIVDDAVGITLTCVATSGGGMASRTVTIARDATPPAISYAGNQGTYLLHEQVAIDCSFTDNLSGVAADTCVDANAPAYTFGVGSHTLSADATDVAGNNGSGSTTFTVIVDDTGLKNLIDRLLPGQPTAKSLKNKVDQVFSAPNASAARGKLDALRNEIRAQTGKAISPETAQILLGILDSL